jgi:hypothetical protein
MQCVRMTTTSTARRVLTAAAGPALARSEHVWEATLTADC